MRTKDRNDLPPSKQCKKGILTARLNRSHPPPCHTFKIHILPYANPSITEPEFHLIIRIMSQNLHSTSHVRISLGSLTQSATPSSTSCSQLTQHPDRDVKCTRKRYSPFASARARRGREFVCFARLDRLPFSILVGNTHDDMNVYSGRAMRRGHFTPLSLLLCLNRHATLNFDIASSLCVREWRLD